jgi:Type II CAAX prenyl endopeptidase Rce1-like
MSIAKSSSIAHKLPGMPRSSVKQYWETSRSPRYSLLFALPLLLLYELLVVALSRGPGGGIRNGADVLLQQAVYAVAGRYEPIVFGVVVLGIGAWLVTRDIRAHRGPLRGGTFVAMLAESILLALAFGTVVGTITVNLLHLAHGYLVIAPGAIERSPLATRVMLSLGAGIYEELLFRVIIAGALDVAARKVLGWRPWVAGTFAVLVSATIFSACHYIGPYGDPLRLDSFVYRLIGGCVFSALYLIRGFGITAWTHALYDLLVLAL